MGLYFKVGALQTQQEHTWNDIPDEFVEVNKRHATHAKPDQNAEGSRNAKALRENAEARAEALDEERVHKKHMEIEKKNRMTRLAALRREAAARHHFLYNERRVLEAKAEAKEARLKAKAADERATTAEKSREDVF